MTAPFTKYLDIKDNYCLAYFGEDKSLVSKILESRSLIETDLKGLNIFIVIKDLFKDKYGNIKNVIFESNMNDYKGKMACFRNLEKKDDLKALLDEFKIIIQ
jgi:hypothetical protein